MVGLVRKWGKMWKSAGSFSRGSAYSALETCVPTAVREPEISGSDSQWALCVDKAEETVSSRSDGREDPVALM